MSCLAARRAMLAFVLVACGGVDELALNPQGHAAGAGGSQSAPAGDANGMSGAGSQGGTPISSSGGTMTGQATGGEESESEGDAGKPALMSPCGSDDDCPVDGARRCADSGQCVACIEDDDCSNDASECDALTGTCQACEDGTCGSAGAEG